MGEYSKYINVERGEINQLGRLKILSSHGWRVNLWYVSGEDPCVRMCESIKEVNYERATQDAMDRDRLIIRKARCL